MTHGNSIKGREKEREKSPHQKKREEEADLRDCQHSPIVSISYTPAAPSKKKKKEKRKGEPGRRGRERFECTTISTHIVRKTLERGGEGGKKGGKIRRKKKEEEGIGHG